MEPTCVIDSLDHLKNENKDVQRVEKRLTSIKEKSLQTKHPFLLSKQKKDMACIFFIPEFSDGNVWKSKVPIDQLPDDQIFLELDRIKKLDNPSDEEIDKYHSLMETVYDVCSEHECNDVIMENVKRVYTVYE